MQNANIKYLIRLLKPEYNGKEVEITMLLSEMENEWNIRDELEQEHDIQIGGWGGNNYTVIERNIELFNED